MEKKEKKKDDAIDRIMGNADRFFFNTSILDDEPKKKKRTDDD